MKAERAEPHGSCECLLTQSQIRKGTKRSPHQALRQSPSQAVLVHTLSIYARGMGAATSSLLWPFRKGDSSTLCPSVHFRTPPHALYRHPPYLPPFSWSGVRGRGTWVSTGVQPKETSLSKRSMIKIFLGKQGTGMSPAGGSSTCTQSP